MPRRPTNISRIARGIVSTIGGIVLEVAVILWFIVLILGSASVALFLWQLVG